MAQISGPLIDITDMALAIAGPGPQAHKGVHKFAQRMLARPHGDVGPVPAVAQKTWPWLTAARPAL